MFETGAPKIGGNDLPGTKARIFVAPGGSALAYGVRADSAHSILANLLGADHHPIYR
jgi:hypothetical protein